VRQGRRIPFVTGFGDEWFRVGPIKVVADGGILIGTAYLREPYGDHTEIYGYDEPGYRGVLSVPRDNLIEMARVANRLGWQMTAHTTGGGATDALLDAYEAANRDQPIAPRRFTVTHGNFPNAQAIQRARQLGVAFDVQPAWLHFDGPAIKNVRTGTDEGFSAASVIIDGGVVARADPIHHPFRLTHGHQSPPVLRHVDGDHTKTVDGTVWGPRDHLARTGAQDGR
jgi:predicted amidohydrolase YtcJ